jgi:DNA-binding SARP family transcriptional activator
MTAHTAATVSRTDRRAARRDRLVGFAAAAGTLLLLAGPPAALSVSVGWPLPHRLPSMGELHTFLVTPLSDQDVLKVLATVGWLLWAQLAGAVLLELSAQLRGLSAPRLPLMSFNQQLAQRLVSTTLLLLPASQPLLAGGPLTAYTRAVAVTASSTEPHALAPAASGVSKIADRLGQPAAAEPRIASLSASSSAAESLPVVDTAAPANAVGPSAPMTPTASQPLEARPTALKQYTVTAPDGRHHDSLWAIAARHLGDGRRYPEIFALNHGRPQPDGGALTKASLIRPGWVLLLPADATGPGLQTATATRDSSPDLRRRIPPPEHRPPALPAPQRAADPAPVVSLTAPMPVASQVPQAPPDQEQRQRDGAAHESVRQPAHPRPEHQNLLEELGLGLGAVAALAALTRARKAALRRRPRGRRLPPPTPQLRAVETALRREAHAHAALAADVRAGCALAAATTPTAAHRAMTGVLRHDDQRLEILTDPAATNAAAPPVPFTATSHGWQLAATDRGFLCAAETLPDPMPVLLPVGRVDPTRHDDRAQLYVDLARLGLISLDGAEADCDAVCLTAAAELTGAPWAGLTQLGELERLEPVSDITSRLPQLLSYASTARIAPPAASTPGQPDNVSTDAAGESQPDHYQDAGDSTLRMVLIGWDAAELPAALADAALDPRQPVVVLATTPHPRAAETWSVHDGQLAGVLGTWQLEARPRNPQASDVSALLRQPDEPDLPEDDPALRDLREDSPPQPPPVAAPQHDVDAAADAAASPAGEPAGAASHTVAISDDNPDITTVVAEVDGTNTTSSNPQAVEIGILGPVQLTGVEMPRRVPVRQILVYLALHRREVQAEQLATALWPNTRTASQTLRNRVAEARALVDGQISEGPGWRMYDSVSTDWQRFQHLASGDAESRQRALELVRGMPLEDFPDAEWIDTEGLRSHIEATVVDLALHVSEDALAEGQPAQAFWAAKTGLRASPYEERLFRLAMRAAGAEGATGKVRALMRELRTVLDLELEPDDTIQPETLSLYRELLGQPRPQTD